MTLAFEREPAGAGGSARAWARAIRHAPDRLLHPLRRRRARALVRARRPIQRVLILCHGNVCRSPYAEVSLRRLLARNGGGASVPEIQSAGFIGPGRSSPAAARRVAERRGIDLGRHRSRLVRPEELPEADVVVVMDPAQRGRVRSVVARDGPAVVLLGDFDPERIRTRRILDPWNRPEDAFHEVYNRIDRCLEELARALHGPTPNPVRS